MATLKDVAELAGVSTATVSYVLNGRENKVSAEVAVKVRRAAEKLSYKPNMMARALRSNRTNIIGVLSEDITTYQVNNIVKGINTAADEHKYQIILGDLSFCDKIWNGTYQDYTKAVNYKDEIRDKISIFKAAGASGVIYVGMHDRDVTDLVDTDLPLVYAYCYTRNPGDLVIDSDNQKISGEVVNAMIEKGHRRIGLISGPVDSVPAYKRLMGYQTALMQAGLVMDPELIAYGNWSDVSGRTAVKELMTRKDPPTAIFCMNDWMAFGAMKELKNMGTRIGRDIELVGFDDVELCEFVEPQLTSVKPPLEEIGKEAAKMMISLIGREEVKPLFEELPCVYKERETFRRKPPG